MNIQTSHEESAPAAWFLLCLALGAATPAFATNYYIATNGNDDWDGRTTSTAWKTMSQAMSVSEVGGGDTIIVLNGTYKQSFNISKGGSSSARLVVKAQNRLGAVIDADHKRDTGIYITGSFVTVDGFIVENSEHAGIQTGGAHHITVTNCESRHNKGAGIYGGASSDFLWIDRNHVWDNAWGHDAGEPQIVTSGISIHLPENISGDSNTTNTRTRVSNVGG